jgi:hypothetical protein
MSANVITVESSLLEGIVNFIDLASMTTKQAVDEVEVHRTAQSRAATLQEPLINHLKTLGIVKTAEDIEQTRLMLGAHDTTLQLLKGAADRIHVLSEQLKHAGRTKSAGDIGHGEDMPGLGGSSTPEGRTSLNSPVVGGDYDGLKESDRILLRGLR